MTDTGNGMIGKPVDRVDGRLKVTGRARYAAEFEVDDLAYGALAVSTISSGRIRGIDSREALRSPGVIAVISHLNAPRLPFLDQKAGIDPPVGRVLRVLQEDTVHFNGQPVAVVVANTLEQAEHAATLIRVDYEKRPHATSVEDEISTAFEPERRGRGANEVRGDVNAIKKAEVSVEAEYTIPIEHHNPMELLATIAHWDSSGQRLTLYDKTQFVPNVREHLAKVFGLPEGNVHVICPFIGGGFGSSLRVWSHPIVAALAARMTKRPVKLMLTRSQMFTSHGHRPYTIQRMALGAGRDGKLTAIVHEGFAQTSMYEDYTEALMSPTQMLYQSPNCITKYRLVRGNVQTPTFMRGPGESSGVFALDSSLDDLAFKLKIDPLEFRIRNHADKDPSDGLPWSSKSLLECYKKGADAFGWSRRPIEPRSMRSNGRLVGWGMGTATYPMLHFPASAKARVLSDGTAVVQSSASDMGPGTWTTMKIIGAEALGLPVERVRSELGDSALPRASVHGGSSTTASVGTAIHEACLAARQQILELARNDDASPLRGFSADSVSVKDGRIFLTADPDKGETYSDILRRHKKECVEATADSRARPDTSKYSMHAFGAHFVEVSIDEQLGTIRVTRVVSSCGAGRILNEKTAISQIVGGVIGGIGMALMEETVTDHRTGRFVNANFGEYHVPVNADIGRIEAIFVEERDEHVNPLGVKGIGEISYVGVAAAVANAVFHATGKRIRHLPITLDKVI